MLKSKSDKVLPVPGWYCCKAVVASGRFAVDLYSHDSLSCIVIYQAQAAKTADLLDAGWRVEILLPTAALSSQRECCDKGERVRDLPTKAYYSLE